GERDGPRIYGPGREILSEHTRPRQRSKGAARQGGAEQDAHGPEDLVMHGGARSRGCAADPIEVGPGRRQAVDRVLRVVPEPVVAHAVGPSRGEREPGTPALPPGRRLRIHGNGIAPLRARARVEARRRQIRLRALDGIEGAVAPVMERRPEPVYGAVVRVRVQVLAPVELRRGWRENSWGPGRRPDGGGGRPTGMQRTARTGTPRP